MITQLLPLLDKGNITLTITRPAKGSDVIRVTAMVLAHDKESAPKLPTLSVEGTATDLDAGLPEVLGKYSSATVSLTDSLADMQKQVKQIEDAKRVELAAKVKSKTNPAPKTPSKAPAASQASLAPAPEGDLFSTSDSGDAPTVAAAADDSASDGGASEPGDGVGS